MSNKIPYENLQILNSDFEDTMKIKFSEFISNGWYILGEEVNKFEKILQNIAVQNIVLV